MLKKRFIKQLGLLECLIASLLILALCLPEQKVEASTLFAVDAFGAVGNGVHDDGPAIDSAIQAAVAAAGEKTVSFAAGKTYRIGNKADAYTYFKIFNATDLTIDGNGATLLFEPNNYPFQIENSSNTVLKDLTIDYEETTAAEGSILSIDRAKRSFDVQLRSDSPEPPTDSVVLAKGKYPTTGPVHGIVFQPDQYIRQTTGDRNFFNPVSITDQGNRVFRFVMPSDATYGPFMTDLQVNDRISYNFAGLKLTSAENTAKSNWYKDRDPGTTRIDFAGASFKIEESSNVTLQNINSYFSPVMFAVVYDNNGTILFNHVNIKRKPGSDRLMANGSDGIHVNNNRGSIVIDGCYMEGANDDLINISDLGYIVSTIKGPDSMVLRSSGLAVYYDYHVKVNDTIMFTDFDHNRILGTSKVTAVNRLSPGSYQVVLDQTPAGVGVGTPGFDMNQTNPDSRIVNNVLRPVMRQAGIVRMNGGTISNNTIEGLGGIGFRLSDSVFHGSAEGILAHDINITNNTFDSMENWGISMTTGLKDFYNLHDAKLVIANNTMTHQKGNGIDLSNLKDVKLLNNRISMDPQASLAFKALTMGNVRDAVISNLSIADSRAGIGVAALCNNCEESTVTLNHYTADLANDVVPFNLSQKVDDADPSVAYSGTWSKMGAPSDYNATLSSSSTTNDQASFTFTGNSIQYLSRKGPDEGFAEVTVDGNPLYTRTVDLYNATIQYKASVYQTSELPYGRHTITVRVIGSKRPSSSGIAVNVDAFEFNTAQNRLDQSDIFASYTGTWSDNFYYQDYGGGLKVSSTPNDSMQLSFTGSSIIYGARKGPSMGIVNVSIDGDAPQPIDLYTPSPSFQVKVFQRDGLTAGSHTLKVTLTGKKNAAANAANGSIDYFELPVSTK